jgi:hypothetical protein
MSVNQGGLGDIQPNRSGPCKALDSAQAEMVLGPWEDCSCDLRLGAGYGKSMEFV